MPSNAKPAILHNCLAWADMNIDLRRMRHVVEIARAGGVSAAARSLNITQPALTRSLAEVETVLGMDLFHRTPRGVTVTDAGRIFVTRARKMLRDFDDLMGGMADHRDLAAGRLRIGFASSMFEHFVSDAIARLVTDHPGLGVETMSGPVGDMVPKLNTGELDLLLGPSGHFDRWPELAQKPLFNLHCRIIVRTDHPLSKLGRSPTAREILACPQVQVTSVDPGTSHIYSLYATHGLAPRDPFYVCHDFTMLKRIVANTDAFATVFNNRPAFGRLARDFLLLDDMIGMPDLTFALATHRDRAPGPAATAFADLVAETAQISETAA